MANKKIHRNQQGSTAGTGRQQSQQMGQDRQPSTDRANQPNTGHKKQQQQQNRQRRTQHR